MKNKTKSPKNPSPPKELGGPPENDQDARDARIKSATAERGTKKRTKK